MSSAPRMMLVGRYVQKLTRASRGPSGGPGMTRGPYNANRLSYKHEGLNSKCHESAEFSVTLTCRMTPLNSVEWLRQARSTIMPPIECPMAKRGECG